MKFKICKGFTVTKFVEFYDECRKVKEDDSKLTLEVEEGITPDFVALFLNTLREQYNIKSIFFPKIPPNIIGILQNDSNITWEMVTSLKLNIRNNNLSHENLNIIAESCHTNVITLNLETLGDNT